MILYFRANITYDYSRVGYDDISIDYALAPFAKTTPMRGIYEYILRPQGRNIQRHVFLFNMPILVYNNSNRKPSISKGDRQNGKGYKKSKKSRRKK